jgi:hypothetical protein
VLRPLLSSIMLISWLLLTLPGDPAAMLSFNIASNEEYFTSIDSLMSLLSYSVILFCKSSFKRSYGERPSLTFSSLALYTGDLVLPLKVPATALVLLKLVLTLALITLAASCYPFVYYC